jgi:hypothetical protein
MVPDEHLLARFFVPSKRERYAEMISKPKKRTKFLAELDHFKSLDPRYVVPIAPNDHSPDRIAVILTKKGAPSLCWITSSFKDLDGQQRLLSDALKEIVGRQMGTLLTCIPGALAYYEGEEMRDWCILERRD